MRFKLRDLQDALSVFGQKTWVVLNSQFTLWALGGLAAVVGTVIAMAYSDVKNCRKELDDLRVNMKRRPTKFGHAIRGS